MVSSEQQFFFLIKIRITKNKIYMYFINNDIYIIIYKIIDVYLKH